VKAVRQQLRLVHGNYYLGFSTWVFLRFSHYHSQKSIPLRFRRQYKLVVMAGIVVFLQFMLRDICSMQMSFTILLFDEATSGQFGPHSVE